MARSKARWIVEISDLWVKWVGITPQGNGWRLLAAACVPFSDEEQAKSWLLSQLRQLKEPPSAVLGLIPRHQVMVRQLRLPSQDPEEISKMISLQAPTLIPYAVQEAVWSSQFLEIDPDGYAQVLVAVAPRTVISRFVRIAEGAGLTLGRIGISSLGLAQWLRQAGKTESSSEGITVLIDLDASTVEIDLLESGIPLLTRAAPYLDEGTIEGALVEIRRTVATPSREIAGKRVSRLYLTGISERLPLLANRLGLELKVSVEALDPMASLQLPVGGVTSLPASIVPLIGLGMETKGALSLLPPEFISKRLASQERRQALVTAVLLAGVVLTGIGALGWPLLSQSLQLKRIQAYLQELAPAKEQVEATLSQLKVAQEYRHDQGLALKILKELYTAVPARVGLTLVTLDAQESLVIKGQAPAMSEVLSLVTVLENSPLFHNVKVRFANKRMVREQEIADFEIQCPLNHES